MIGTIVKREFLDNLFSFKFIACVLVAIILTTISTIVHTNDYRDRLDNFNKGMASAQDALTQVPAYSFLKVDIYKRPSVLSIFIPGIEHESGNSVTITHREIPTSLQGGIQKNEFATVFSFFDLSSIIINIFTLMTILLAYGSISAEKEGGTLALSLSNDISRARILVGKFLGGMISVTVPLTLCFLGGILIVLLSKNIQLDPGILLSMCFIYLFSLLYLSSIFLFGMLISSLTKTSSQSLIIILAFYLVTVFLLPTSINSAADGIVARKANDYEKNINALINQRNADLAKAESDIMVKSSWVIMKAMPERINALLGRLNPPSTIAHYEIFFERSERLVEQYAQRIYALRQQDYRIRESTDRLRNLALALVPSSCFMHAAELEAGTGAEGLNLFFQQLSLYWHEYVRYLDEKRAFSLTYSYPYPRELPFGDRILVDEVERVWAEKKIPIWKDPAFGEILKRNKQYEQEIKPLSLKDLPVFTFQRNKFEQRLGSWLLNVLFLIFNNVLMFSLAYFAFARYDPRVEG